jgi:hypothetical protein
LAGGIFAGSGVTAAEPGLPAEPAPEPAAEPEAPDFVVPVQPIIAAHSNSAPRENFFIEKPFRNFKPFGRPLEREMITC